MSNLGRSRRIGSPRLGDFESDAACIFAAAGTEDRGRLHVWNERLAHTPESCCEVLHQEASQITVVIDGKKEVIALRDGDGLRRLFGGYNRAYIDISGLEHRVWAPLLRESFRALRTVWIVYVEPERYRPHSAATSGLMFDLSSSIAGIAPLPGYANLRGPNDEKKALFVPFLGFEGTRARQVAMTLDPVPRVIAVVGAPGFRAEYPSVTITCNQDFLDDHHAHADVRLARANCPFEAYRALSDIKSEFPGWFFYLALVGTKPHALGAIAFAIENPTTTEIMYDHPVRKPQRTYGIGTTHIYCMHDAGP